jgi:hypothetical protein
LVEEELFSLRSEIAETFQAKVAQRNDKSEHDMSIQEKVSNLEALFAEKELGDTDYALQQV